MIGFLSPFQGLIADSTMPWTASTVHKYRPFRTNYVGEIYAITLALKGRDMPFYQSTKFRVYPVFGSRSISTKRFKLYLVGRT